MAVVWTCLLFIISGQNHLARHSEGGGGERKKKRQTEEQIGRQHQVIHTLKFAKSQRAMENREK